MDQAESDRYLAVFYILVRCGAESCEAQAKVYVVVNQRKDGSNLAEDLEGLRRSISEAVLSEIVFTMRIVPKGHVAKL